MLKKIFIALSLIIVIIIFSGCFVIFYLPQLLINNIIHVPPNTTLMYDTSARWGSNVGIRSVYYLSNSNMDGLSNWYKDFYPAFRSGNPQHQWLITVKATDDKALNDKGLKADEKAVLGHESLCNYQYGGDPCVTIAMVDLRVQKPLELLITATNFAPEEKSPLYNLLNSLPKSGTLIIYRHYVLSL